MTTEQTNYTFNSAEHALTWATEILRKTRMAKISGIYREIERPQSVEAQKWFQHSTMLPTEWDDKYALAVKVYNAFHRLPQHMQQVLTLRFWGDYADDRRLADAQQHQLAMRAQGKRVRVSYRYSFRQIGTILGMDHKTASKRVEDALQVLEKELLGNDICCQPFVIAKCA